MHTPVLLTESITALNIRPGGKYIDATFGQGGHTTEIIQKGGTVLALDQDSEQIRKFIEKKGITNNLILVNKNYSEIQTVAESHAFYPVDGILFDLGLSMEQLRNSNRGFSYNNDTELLDMRLNPDIEESAADLINYLSEDSIYEMLAKYSETLFSRQFAQALVQHRIQKKIQTVGELKVILKKVLLENNQTQKHDSVFAQVFQALRIQVNDEYSHIKKALHSSWNILTPGGRLVIITFHSGEDRVVKLESKKMGWNEVIHKPIKGKLRFERSAKMRIYEKPLAHTA